MRSLFLIAAVLSLGAAGPARASDPHARAVAALALASAVVPESRPAPRPTGEVAPLPKAKDLCPCPDGGKCDCGPVCVCESKVKADTPKAGTVWLVKGYAGGVECWIPEGYTMAGWTQTPPAMFAVQWDCSSGVCRPVSGASYSGYPAGGSCASGSCGAPAASYGGGYGSFGAGVMSGGGSCSGGSCGAPAPRGGLFGRRR